MITIVYTATVRVIAINCLSTFKLMEDDHNLTLYFRMTI